MLQLELTNRKNNIFFCTFITSAPKSTCISVTIVIITNKNYLGRLDSKLYFLKEGNQALVLWQVCVSKTSTRYYSFIKKNNPALTFSHSEFLTDKSSDLHFHLYSFQLFKFSVLWGSLTNVSAICYSCLIFGFFVFSSSEPPLSCLSMTIYPFSTMQLYGGVYLVHLADKSFLFVSFKMY